jgi:hypothetical protein
MRIFYGGRNFLAGQDAVGLLLEYSAALARAGSADVVQLRTVDPDGTVEEVSFVVGAGIPIVGETSHAIGPGPANSTIIDYMTGELERLRSEQPRPD